MNCQSCGSENEDGALFCRNCGMRLAYEEPHEGQAEEDQKEKERQEEREKIRQEEQEKQEALRKRDQERFQAELKEKTDEIRRLTGRLEGAEQDMKKNRRTVRIGGIIGLVLIAILGITAISSRSGYDSLERENRRLRDTAEEYEEKAERQEELEKQLSEIKSYLDTDVLVKITDIYNGTADRELISSVMMADEMRYLIVEYDVYVLDEDLDQPLNFYIDMYLPNGELEQYSNSADGHTSPERLLQSGEADAWGLGNDEESIYETGPYRIEIVCGDEVLASQTCYIY